MFPRFNARVICGAARAIYVPRVPLPPHVSPKREVPWMYEFKGLPGTPEETTRRIEHATLYYLKDEYDRGIVGVVPESKYLNDLLFEWRGVSPLEIDRNYTYIAAAFAGASAIDPRAIISTALVYMLGGAQVYVPFVVAKRKIARALNDPDCAEFIRNL